MAHVERMPGRLLLLVLAVFAGLCAHRGEGRISLLEEYIRQHNGTVVAALGEKALCSAKFVILQVHCRSSMGNELMMFLNGLALSVIQNRTVLLHVDPQSCDGRLTFAAWLPRWEGTLNRLSSSCGISAYADLDFSFEESESASPIGMSCCNIEVANGESTLVKYQRMDRMQASVLSYKGVNISAAAHKRARDLFAIPAKGPLYGYGQLFQATLKFSHTVQRWNEQYVSTLQRLRNATSQNLTVLGVHMRHQMEEEKGKLQGYEAVKTLECMQMLLPQDRRENCVIILATDRQRTLIDVQGWAQNAKIKCKLMHSASAHEDDSRQYGLGKHDVQLEREEHGPWGDSLLVFTDMHLMSLSNVFVGSKGFSTYASSLSILFASIIAGKTGQARTQRFPPSCTTLGFNGEIFNGSLLYRSAPGAEDIVDDGKKMQERRTLVQKDDGSSKVVGKQIFGKFSRSHESLYSKYLVDDPVLDCNPQVMERCSSYNSRRLLSGGEMIDTLSSLLIDTQTTD